MKGSAQRRGTPSTPFPAAAPKIRPGRLHRRARCEQGRDSRSKTSHPLSSEYWVAGRSPRRG
jgi:hypothetical protein